MPTLQLLNEAQQKNFDSCPRLTLKQRLRYFAMDEQIIEYIGKMREPVNQVGFLVQLAYFRSSGKFFPNANFRNVDIKYACSMLWLDHTEVTTASNSYSANSKSVHKTYILEHSGWQKFTEKYSEKLHNELLLHAKQQMHPKSLLPIAANYLINCKIELPPYYVFANIISDVYNKMENQLVNIVDRVLLKYHKDILDDLIWVGDKRRKHYKYSALSRIKQFSHSTKIKHIEESIKNYTLLKTFTEEFKTVYQHLGLSESATAYYSEWVSKSKLFQLKQFKNRSKAYLYLLAHIKHQYFRQTDLYIDIIIKLVGNAKSSIHKAMEKHAVRILREQKLIFEVLANSNKDSKHAFKQILRILDDKEKSEAAKDEQIRLIILAQLKTGDNKQTDDDLLIEKIMDKDLSTQELNAKLLKTMGAGLQKKLTPIICALKFDQLASNNKTYQAIQQFVSANGKVEKEAIKAQLTEQELTVVNILSVNNILVYKGILFSKVFDSIKSGELSLSSSYNYIPIKQYFIDDIRWLQAADTLIEASGLKEFSSFDRVIDTLTDRLIKKYQHVNDEYSNGSNKYLSFKKTGEFIISTPKAKDIYGKNKLAPIFAREGIIPISRVLEQINNATNFVKCFKHHAIKKVIMKPTPETIFAGILSKGCNHGTLKMANISKGINKTILRNTVKWFFSLENIQEANNVVVEYINNLSLPNIYMVNKYSSHTSSDGQKFNVGVDSILANYSFKYFGQSQGISVYTFIDDRQVLFYNTILSPGVREAAFVIDGLMENTVIKSHMHSTDTHGFSEVIFATMHLLGVSFAPRIKKLGSQTLYCLDSKRAYRNKDYKIKPDKKINTKLIKDNWDDILRLVTTIKTKTVTASQIFTRFNSYTKEQPLYKALKEFGRIIKTMYILTYVDDVLLRKQIEKQLNKIELSNKFAKAVFFANCQEFRVGSTTEQKIIVACKGFIQNCIVLWNYLYLSKVLLEYSIEDQKILLHTIKNSSIISWQHINLHGEYDFTAANDSVVNVVLDLKKIRKLKVA